MTIRNRTDGLPLNPHYDDAVIASDYEGGKHYPWVRIGVADGPSSDAFNRLRVAEPRTLFDSKLLYGDAHGISWDEELVSGTMATSGPTVNAPYIDFTSTNETAGRRVRQTFNRFSYQPGKSQLVLMTGVLELASGVKTGCERRIGLYDDNNGMFFESDAGTIGVTVRSKVSGSVVDTTTTQANWNVDPMDGTGPSGITLDITKSQIFIIDFQWLSIGRVRFGFEIGGRMYYVHETSEANITQVPYCSTPNLPLRYEIITTTSSGVCSMRCICAAVLSEGGTDEHGIQRWFSSAGTTVTSAAENTLYAVVGIRLKDNYEGAFVVPTEVHVQVQSLSENIEWVLLHGSKNHPITVGGTFTYNDVSNSFCQKAVGATANTVTGGIEVAGGYVVSGTAAGGGGANQEMTRIETDARLGVAIDGTKSEFILAFRPIGGVSAVDVEGGLLAKERD